MATAATGTALAICGVWRPQALCSVAIGHRFGVVRRGTIISDGHGERSVTAVGYSMACRCPVKVPACHRAA